MLAVIEGLGTIEVIALHNPLYNSAPSPLGRNILPVTQATPLYVKRYDVSFDHLDTCSLAVLTLALFPGSCAWEEEREPGCSNPCVNYKLLSVTSWRCEV